MYRNMCLIVYRVRYIRGSSGSVGYEVLNISFEKLETYEQMGEQLDSKICVPVCIVRFAPQWAQPLEHITALPINKRRPGHQSLGANVVQCIIAIRIGSTTLKVSQRCPVPGWELLHARRGGAPRRRRG